MSHPTTYAVDFDGTLCENAYPEIGAPNLSLIDKLISRRRLGAKVILWTCREGELLNILPDNAKASAYRRMGGNACIKKEATSHEC